jgi:hypothetical protein
MPATIIRNPSKRQLTLISSQSQVQDDGLVTVTAEFLPPESGLDETTFRLDSPWPLSTPPIGIPPIQGGPFLVSRTIEKREGILMVAALYTSAVNPPRVVKSQSESQQRFSGYGSSEDGETSGSVAFDYTATQVNVSYAIVRGNAFVVEPDVVDPKNTTNVSIQGDPGLVNIVTTQIKSEEKQDFGLVTRITKSSSMLYQQPGEINITR